MTVLDVGDRDSVNAGVTGVVTVSETEVVSVNPPPEPVMVIGVVPAAALELTVNVAVDDPEPGTAMGLGLKPTVTPEGAPDELSVTAASNPFAIAEVMDEVPLLPFATDIELGDEDRLNDGVGDEEPASAVIRPLPFGLPHPVARS